MRDRQATAIPEAPAAPEGRKLSDRGLKQQAMRAIRKPEAGALAGTLVVFAFFAVATAGNGFLSSNGTATWLNLAAELAIVAIPVGLLMIGGEFDLSVASVIGMGALTVSVGSGYYEMPLLVSIALALGLAVIVGMINGLVTVRTRVPSMIVTLATLLALGGAILFITRTLTATTNVSVNASGWVHTLFAGSWHQFNASIVWCVVIALFASWILARTVFGNWVLATGGDEAAAAQAGVPTDKVKVTLFVASALGASLLGIIQALVYSTAQVGQGQSYIFLSIVAAVIGGVLLQGGYGSALGIVSGAITYGIVSTGIFYTGWNSDLADVFIGLLVLAAVLANNFLRQLAMRG